MAILGGIAFQFNIIPSKYVRFYRFQVKTHIQTACEFHDLNIYLVLFDNGFKRLCIYILHLIYCVHNVVKILCPLLKTV